MSRQALVGLNAYHPDASAALVTDGVLRAAAEEERFIRVKHVGGFPSLALHSVLETSGVPPAEVELIAVARDPWARFLRKVIYGLTVPKAALERAKVQGKFLTVADGAAEVLGRAVRKARLIRVEHHKAHLSSSFFVSPFDEAALFSLDGVGDFATAMWGVGRGNRLEPFGAVPFPHSVGLFYTALTQYLGFLKYGDEYKVMGLASYGEPEYLEQLRKILVSPASGAMRFRVDRSFFTQPRADAASSSDEGEPILGRLYSDRLVKMFGPAREPGEPIEKRHQNIASSVQRRLEEVELECLRTLRQLTGLRNLCLAGGVALNCVVNGKILEETGFEDIYVQCAAGDNGLAIGAAMYAWHHLLGHSRQFIMNHAYWGPEFDDPRLRAALEARRGEIDREGCIIHRVDDEEQLCRVTAGELAQGKVIGWFQGRMEWGPRALGNRSILADPRCADIRELLNRKIKRRELFRPFAPSILEEFTGEYFTQSYPSPFMLMAYPVRAEKRAVIPATTHVDGTGRLQTVTRESNPRYHKLIREFYRQTGVPVLLNTSFNENEPVVCKPEEALDCFLRTKMDVLVLGNLMVSRHGSRA